MQNVFLGDKKEVVFAVNWSNAVVAESADMYVHRIIIIIIIIIKDHVPIYVGMYCTYDDICRYGYHRSTIISIIHTCFGAFGLKGKVKIGYHTYIHTYILTDRYHR